jgi:hypothetical protein
VSSGADADRAGSSPAYRVPHRHEFDAIRVWRSRTNGPVRQEVTFTASTTKTSRRLYDARVVNVL